MNQRRLRLPILLMAGPARTRRGQGRGGRFSSRSVFLDAAIFTLALFLILIGACPRASAATAQEKRAFKIAMDFLSSTFYQRAESEFGEFVTKFPESDMVPEAVLHQAQARYFVTNYAGAVELLTGRLSSAGPLLDQYLFLRGEAEFKQSSYSAAADTFGRLVHDYPASPLRLQAAVEEAAVFSAMSSWGRVIDLLRDQKGVFHIAATSTNAATTSRSVDEDQLIIRGYLMLGEALFAQGQLGDADDTLNQLRGRPIEYVPAWQWQYLLCRIRIAQGHLADALNDCANLVTRAESTGQPGLRADSISFKARLLEKMDRPEEAITTFAENLDLKISVPAERQREALLNIAALSIARNQIPEAARNIELFLAQFPASPAGDLGWFTLGELRLRQRMDAAALLADGAVTNAAAVTNFLGLSREAFTRVVTGPASPLRGRAEMNLGWCGWLADDLQASAEGFQGAIEHLPLSMDQAQARYKLGDVRFRQNQFKEAESNYLYVTDHYLTVPDVATNLVEPALYQAVRAGLRAGDIPSAYAALTNILIKFPDGFHSDALLLYGHDISLKGHPEDARSLYGQFLAQTPEAALRPQVELGIARTWEEQDKWPEAIKQYESWLAVFTNHPARPQAEYFHALALVRVGDTTNALICFTNFVARFPTEPLLTPLAQWHVGNIEYSQGDLKEAEKQFQLITKGPSALPYQARLMAGKCAVERQVWKDATNYFISLYTDTNCPTDLRLEALFAFGDLEVVRTDTTNKISDYEEAIRVFTTIAENYPTNRLAPLAWGQKAICLMQWTHKVQPNQPDALTNVLASFQKVLDSPQAGITARGLARIGLGIVLEKMAEPKTGSEKQVLQERALEYYAEVCFEASVPGEERPDPFCVEKAGLEAIRLAEDLQRWPTLIRLCDRLEALLPSLHDSLFKKKQKAQENLARASL